MESRNAKWGGAVMLTLVLIAGCDLLDPSSTYERIAGTYEATTFTIAGPADGLVEVLDAGGSLVLTLDDDGSMKGDLSLGPSSFDTTFTARYSVYRDTVYINDTQVMPRRKLVWNEDAGTLTAPPAEGWLGLYQLELAKR